MKTGWSLGLRRWAPPVLYVLLVYRLSMEPTVPTIGIWASDKLLHVIEYGLLGLLFARGLGREASRRQRGAAVALGVVVGVVDEWIQSHTPGRDATIHDVLADVVGVSLGVGWGCRFWAHRFVRRFA